MSLTRPLIHQNYKHSLLACSFPLIISVYLISIRFILSLYLQIFYYSTEIQPFFCATYAFFSKFKFPLLTCATNNVQETPQSSWQFPFHGQYMGLDPRHQTTFLVHGNVPLIISIIYDLYHWYLLSLTYRFQCFLKHYISRWYSRFSGAKLLKYACNININFSGNDQSSFICASECTSTNLFSLILWWLLSVALVSQDIPSLPETMA